MSDDFAFSVEERVKLMRRLGIRRLDMNGWEVELGPPPEPEVAPAVASPSDASTLMQGPPEGDDALFWSSTGPLPSEARDAAQPPQE